MDLKSRIVSAVGWSLGVKLLMQMVTWAATLLVIRLLAPEDYGLMAIAQVFLNLVIGLASMGLGDAMVQRARTTPEEAGRVFGWSLLLSSLLAIAMAVAAYPIARLYGEPRLVVLLQVASLNLPLTALATLPRAALTKELRMRPLVVVESVSAVLGAALTFGLALMGQGVWALMLGALAASIARTAALLALAPESLARPRLGVAGLGGMASFGAFRAGEHLAWVAMTSVDVLIIGRLLGTEAAGVYAVALNFAMMPVSKVAPVINATAFSAFALVQSQPSEARYYLLKATRLAALVAVAVLAGLHATAAEVVPIVFGDHWAAATPVLALLALSSVFRAIWVPWPNYMLGVGRAGGSFACAVAGLVLAVPALVIGCQFGVEGAAAAWLAMTMIHLLVMAVVTGAGGAVSARDLLTAPVPALLAGVAMLAVLYAVRPLVAEWSAVMRLAVLVPVGAAVYLGVIAIAFRPLLAEAFALVRRK